MNDPPSRLPSVGLSDRLASDEVLRLVVDRALSAAVAMDEDGSISGWGARAEETMGWTKEEALGRDLADLIIPPRYREDHRRGLARFRETGEGPVLGTILEVSAVHRDGHEFPVELRITPAIEIGGGTLFLAFVMDISERTAAREALRKEVDESAARTAAWDAFVHGLVHDLRTPLSVALGYVDLMRMEGEVAGPFAEHLDMVEAKLHEAMGLTDDVLAGSRLAAHISSVEPQSLDARDAARRAVENARAKLDLGGATGGAVRLELPPHPVMVCADPGQTARILDNLVENALRYSDPPVAITIQLDETGAITVSDAGRGIPAGMHDRVFERFVRVREKGTPAGTGLGLFIARQLAEQQGGSLELVRSGPGEGSSFRLTLPLDTDQARRPRRGDGCAE